MNTLPAIRYKVTWGGIAWRWLTIVNLNTGRVLRFWEGM